MAAVTYELYARCAAGFEDVLADELRSLGMARVRPQVGGVSYQGRLRQAYESLLWSRVATRIQLVLSRVSCTDAEALYKGVRAMAWEDVVREGATIAVRAHGQNKQLRNTAFVALKVKDAVCDRLREARGSRPDVDAHDPDLSIDVGVHPTKATVSLNLSGPSLHLRGYREDGVQTVAPLRETLAAGMLLAAGWPDVARAGGVLAEPMCGSGTFAVEAALIALDRAPGLARERWGFQGWLGHDEGIWRSVVEAARRRADEGWSEARIIAGDIDECAVAIARTCVERAGVEGLVDLVVADARDLGRRLARLGAAGPSGLMVANPPYGIRLGADEGLGKVRSALAQAASALPDTWGLAVISPDAGIDTALGRVPVRTIACRNGSLPVRVAVYEMEERGRSTCTITSLDGVTQEVGVSQRTSEQFAGRLRKVARDRLRRARREGLSCVRLYDADLPDYACAIECLKDADGERHVVVDEYPRPASLDEWRADARMADVCAIVAAVLGIDQGQVCCHPWRRDGKREQARPRLCQVTEAGLALTVDLDGRPDTGLPLWQRSLRSHVRERAPGKRCVCVGGRADLVGVFAAAGGACTSRVVEPYPDRARLVEAAAAANGLTVSVERADTFAWIAREVRAHHVFDFVVVAPPAWEAGQAKGSEFELVRDHVALLREASRLLARGGTLWFCCRERAFSPDLAGLKRAGLAISDRTGSLTPWDFARSRVAPLVLEVTREG